MPQIFTPSADVRLRLFLALAVVGLVGGGLLAGGYVTSGYATLAGWTVDQPVPFSHKHHVGELGHRLPLLPRVGGAQRRRRGCRRRRSA